MVTAAQITAAQGVQTALANVEASFPGSRPVALLHRKLAVLLDTFQGDLTPAQYTAFGGGTPKTEPGGGEG